MISKNDWFNIIDVSKWDIHQNNPFSTGARSKEILINPSNSPKELFLYKLSTENTNKQKDKDKRFRFPYDFWMEIIAYRLGGFFGFNIPETFPAKKQSENKLTYGSLQKWFLKNSEDLKQSKEKNDNLKRKEFLDAKTLLCKIS